MIPRKNSGADRLGIKFTGNPDAKDCFVPRNNKKVKSIIKNPGKYAVGSLSESSLLCPLCGDITTTYWFGNLPFHYCGECKRSI